MRLPGRELPSRVAVPETVARTVLVNQMKRQVEGVRPRAPRGLAVHVAGVVHVSARVFRRLRLDLRGGLAFSLAVRGTGRDRPEPAFLLVRSLGRVRLRRGLRLGLLRGFLLGLLRASGFRGLLGALGLVHGLVQHARLATRVDGIPDHLVHRQPRGVLLVRSAPQNFELGHPVPRAFEASASEFENHGPSEVCLGTTLGEKGAKDVFSWNARGKKPRLGRFDRTLAPAAALPVTICRPRNASRTIPTRRRTMPSPSRRLITRDRRSSTSPTAARKI